MRSKYHIFLSYRREDGKDLARTLKETLTGKGYRVFLDMDDQLIITNGFYGLTQSDAEHAVEILNL